MYLSRVTVGRFLHRHQNSFPSGIACEKAAGTITSIINRPCRFSIFSRNNFIPKSEFNLATTTILNISSFKMTTNGYHADDLVLQQVLDLVRNEKLLCDAAESGAQKVVEFVHPKELEKCLGGLEIGSGPTDEDDVKDFMEKVVRYSVKTCHHRFYNQV